MIIHRAALGPELRTALFAWAEREHLTDRYSGLGVMYGDAWAGRKVSEGTEAAALVSRLTDLEPEVRGLRWEAWPVILRPGGAVGWHDHHQAKRAAVVYVAVSRGAGALVFDTGRIRPRAGDVVFFGPLARHCVEAGKGLRVSVSVNFYGE